MIYTRQEYGRELKQSLFNEEPIELIGHKAYTIYMEQCLKMDNRFKDILLTLNLMEDGPEFAFSYKELHQIADDLIAGKDIVL